MRVIIRALLVAVAMAGAAAEVWAVRSGWSWASAALDLLAGWSLVAAAGWATHVTGGCRTLLGLSAVGWFLATPQVVGGPLGHDAALLGAAWLAPLATALLGSPDARPARPFQRAAAAATWVRALPALAGLGWLTAATGGCLATAALLDARRYAVRAPRVASAAVGVVLCAAGVLEAVAGRGSALEPLVAVTVAGCGLAVLAAALLDLARSAGAEASVRIDGDIDGDLAVVAWFAATEAIANALKHAGPARIWLSAATEAACLRVQVADDGVGGADPDGRGVRGLAERLAEHGGRLHLLGGERGGTVVVAEIPLTKAAMAAPVQPSRAAAAAPVTGERC